MNEGAGVAEMRGMVEGRGVEESGVGQRRGYYAVREGCVAVGGVGYHGAGADINAGLVGDGGGRDGVGDDGGVHGVSEHGSGVHGVGHHSGAGDDINTGLVRDGGGSVSVDGSGQSVVSQGALLQPVSVSGESVGGKTVSRVSERVSAQQRSGVGEHGRGVHGVGHDGGAGDDIHTGLVRDGGGGVGDHSRGHDGVSERRHGVHERGVVLQSLGLQVQRARVDDLGGVQRAAVRVQHQRGVVRRLRQRQQRPASHGGESEQHHHRSHVDVVCVVVDSTRTGSLQT